MGRLGWHDDLLVQLVAHLLQRFFENVVVEGQTVLGDSGFGIQRYLKVVSMQVFSLRVAEQGEVRGGKVQILFADFDGCCLHCVRLPPRWVKTL